jgi:hypothetical protein
MLADRPWARKGWRKGLESGTNSVNHATSVSQGHPYTRRVCMLRIYSLNLFFAQAIGVP